MIRLNRRFYKLAGPILVLLCLAASAVSQDKPAPTPLLSLDRLMTKDDQLKTGVVKLTAPEREALEHWLSDFALKIVATTTPPARTSKGGKYAGVDQRHRVKSTSERGGFVQLEDGSLWEISVIDRINTTLWLVTDDVVVVENNSPLYPYKLVGDRDSAEAKLVNATESGSLDFYDSTGKAVAYFSADHEMTLYLWSGKPCAYLSEEKDVYGFNGKHLGWFRSGAIYDHEGRLVAALPDSFKMPVDNPPAKGFKEFRPFKRFKEFRPLKPIFLSTWSEIPAKAFFLRGTN